MNARRDRMMTSGSAIIPSVSGLGELRCQLSRRRRAIQASSATARSISRCQKKNLISKW